MNNRAPAKYRSKCRILADILKAVREAEQAKVTFLLHKANLSHDRLTYYLTQLEGSGMIKRVEDCEKTYFMITDVGNNYLTEFRKMEEFGDTFGVEI
jgi:predicted transcriptional regulator